MSPLRKLKAGLGMYPILENPKIEPAGFYQFALNHKKIISKFERIGFECLEFSPFEGFKGLKEETPGLIRKILQTIYDCKMLPCKIIDYVLSHTLAPVSGHAILIILKKTL